MILLCDDCAPTDCEELAIGILQPKRCELCKKPDSAKRAFSLAALKDKWSARLGPQELADYLTLERLARDYDSRPTLERLADNARDILDELWNRLTPEERAGLNARAET